MSPTRTLLVTNDFPPRTGGIQAYLHALTVRLPADSVVVYASNWPGAAGFDGSLPLPVVRDRSSLLLPTPGLARRVRALARAEGISTVWFGAAAPLALLAEPLRRTPVSRFVACTHGHEVGWAMLPGPRTLLRRIGRHMDVVTYLAEYTRERIAPALGPRARLVRLPSGVDVDRFRPGAPGAEEVRARYGLTDRPVVVCVSRLVARKGQDALIRALPAVQKQSPDAALLLVGSGPRSAHLARLAREEGVERDVVLAGKVADAELAAHYAAGQVFAMPCRTRGRGLEVEGLGLVYLEASASGLPVVAGRSGGAPDTVLAGRTGELVDGRQVRQVAAAVGALLADPRRAARMGRAGREWMERDWTWPRLAARLHGLLDPAAERAQP